MDAFILKSGGMWRALYLHDHNALTFFLKLIYLYFLFLAVLGLRCCARAFFSCCEPGLLFVAVHRLLIAVASLVEHEL